MAMPGEQIPDGLEAVMVPGPFKVPCMVNFFPQSAHGSHGHAHQCALMPGAGLPRVVVADVDTCGIARVCDTERLRSRVNARDRHVQDGSVWSDHVIVWFMPSMFGDVDPAI